ncbi:MAG: Uma2 family endonuclease [Bacteroidota bacterium]
MKAYKAPKMTVAQYIDQEIKNDTKYEYHNGDLYALAGGTINHGVLCSNIFSELVLGLRGKGSDCKPFTSEIKLHIVSKNIFVYPDAMVVCEELQPSPDDKNAIVNPRVIVEVLSKSTSDYDRGDKFFFYKQIPTLQEYILIEQEKAVVDLYFKAPGADLWKISRYEGLESTILLESLQIEISMSDLYRDVKNLKAS